jgi:C-terminal processing protease CtpA/Prc
MKTAVLPILFLFLSLNLLASDTTRIRTLTAEQVRKDLAYMVQTMETVHPNIFHALGKEAFQKKYDSVLSTVNGSMTEFEAWPKFAVLIGAINEGHTSISYPSSMLGDSSQLFPLFFKSWERDGFIVQYDLSDEQHTQRGDKLIAVNGESVETIRKRFLRFFGGLPAYKDVVITNQLPFLLAVSGVRAPFTVSVAQQGGVKSWTVNAVTKKEWLARLSRARKADPMQRQPYQYQELEGGIGYLNFRSMLNPARFETFVDSVFSSIRQRQVKGLIIDLRQNGGGNSVLGRQLLSYITTKKYRMAGGFSWKISQQYKDFYNNLPEANQYLKHSNIGKRYLEGVNGTLITGPGDEIKSDRRANAFEGKVCFLISAYTFSSANMLANAVKDFKLATLIGEPTGESPNDYGEVLSLQLPGSKITFTTSTKQFIRANGREDDPDPVLPDYLVKDDPATTEDETMKFAIAWITKK